ncbi:hypothetical protein Athai_18070 [Actinocatenispora thailandica]|uniref:Glycoside-hydrolase family GH114 TIM-barrel domain-containing protein n=1 Tax=Actinocatenispora thailandica TaxID=227318 RepID=A0A7R7DM91_9ACTN|nr:endo alpha-1,4 polygalactosaminidase [Actinocatenispora thailandica]BCJ34304.1 hypothetical protein Athai_18070 [Actinocatenispora thailandica]
MIDRSRSGTRRALSAVIVLAATLVAAGVPAGGVPDVVAPPGNAGVDYQLGAPYPPPSGVRVVSRDRSARPAPGVYTICYVNAYQTQPGELGWWRAHHDDLLLHDADGNEVVDPDWGEVLLDTSTAAKRATLAAVVGRWMHGCARDGFRAVEPDNLDSWTRSRRLLDRSDALAYAGLLIARAHADGLAIGQKNTAEVSAAGRRAGFDFAVAEECAEYGECGDYTAVYGDEVFVIEYDRAGFVRACRTVGERLSVVLRDREVTAPGSASYVHDAC